VIAFAAVATKIGRGSRSQCRAFALDSSKASERTIFQGSVFNPRAHQTLEQVRCHSPLPFIKHLARHGWGLDTRPNTPFLDENHLMHSLPVSY
jgi:hypothetical protein